MEVCAEWEGKFSNFQISLIVSRKDGRVCSECLRNNLKIAVVRSL